MSSHDSDTAAVLEGLRTSLEGVAMRTPVEQILTTGRLRRRRRRLMAGATSVAVAATLALAVTAPDRPATAPPEGSLQTQAGSVHIRTAAFTVDSQRDGTVQVTWAKERYFRDHEGLERALRAAGFPVLIREGVFCKGPQDGGLDPSGVGHGVRSVMTPQVRGGTKGRKHEGRPVFVFKPNAMPPGKQLFIGFLTPSQLAVTKGGPGSVERLVPTGVPLTCTTQAPPPSPRKNGPVDSGPVKPKPDNRPVKPRD
jgi:hypothetical protein